MEVGNRMKLTPNPWPEDAGAEADGLQAIHNELDQTLVDFENAVGKTEKDLRRTPIERRVETEHAQRDSLAELDRLNRSLSTEIEDLQRRKRAAQRIPPPTPERLTRFVEIRAVLRGLSDAQRTAVLQRARACCDELFLRAALDGNAVLVGMSETAFAEFSEQARAALHGAELASIDQALRLTGELQQQLEQARQFISDYHIASEDISRAV